VLSAHSASGSERMLKIGQYFVKLLTSEQNTHFFGPPCSNSKGRKSGRRGRPKEESDNAVVTVYVAEVSEKQRTTNI